MECLFYAIVIIFLCAAAVSECKEGTCVHGCLHAGSLRIANIHGIKMLW